MLNIPWQGWFLIGVGLLLAAYVGGELWGPRLREWWKRVREMEQVGAALDAWGRAVSAGDGAQGAKSGEPRYDPDKTVIALGDKEYAEFKRILDKPPEPNEALKKLLRPKPKSPPKKKPGKRKKPK